MERASINGMCRCCASEGAFKDIKSSYHWMGEEEVYGEMLKRCFDIDLSSTEDSEGGICEVCITQLRNASNFKKQVLQTEEQFKQKLQMKFFKPTIVKVELQDENHQSDDNISNDDGFSGTEFEVSIKKEGTEEPKSKKRPSPAKASTSRAKKPKANEDSAETSTPKRDEQSEFDDTVIIVVGNKDDNRNNDKTKIREVMKKHKANLRQIIKYSNATPILRHIGTGYLCSYCATNFTDPTDLKKHTLDVHGDNVNPLTCHSRSKRIEYCMKLDITSLQCSLCNEEIDTLEELIEHLINSHDVHFYNDIKNQILPFKFNGDQLSCFICGREFEKFKVLQQHMHVHYRNYVCEVCDAGYVNAGGLARHAESHDYGTHKCKYCPKVFSTPRKKKSHERVVHVEKELYRCGYCFKKFKDYEAKEYHLSEEHGVKPIVYQCNACERTFAMRKQLRMHIKREHLMDKRHKCDDCEMSFFSTSELRRHSSKHTDVRYPCMVCRKTYASVRTLKTHMKLHMDESSYNCEHCSKSFSKKTGLKAHLKIAHGM